MIVATRLSAVWQVAGVAGAALVCYLVSQSVAAERAGLAKVDRQITQTHDEIAKLHTEIGVRGRMGQLERWNTEVLALQAPKPSQFVADGVQLASLYGRKGQPALTLDPAIVQSQGAIDKVAYQQPTPAHAQPAPAPAMATPAPQQLAPAQPLLRAATYVRPAPDRLGAAPAVAPAMIEKASYQTAKPAALKPVVATKVVIEAKPVVAKAAPKRASMSLLPDDIGQLAAHERGAKDSNKAAR